MFFDPKTDVRVVPHAIDQSNLRVLDETLRQLGPVHVQARLLRVSLDGTRLVEDHEVGEYLVDVLGRCVVRSADPGFVAFVAAQQGYVRRVVPPDALNPAGV